MGLLQEPNIFLMTLKQQRPHNQIVDKLFESTGVLTNPLASLTSELFSQELEIRSIFCLQLISTFHLIADCDIDLPIFFREVWIVQATDLAQRL